MPVGTLVIPVESDVRLGRMYGGDGTEFTGAMFSPGNPGVVIFTDNADGSGAMATVVGSAGHLNAIYVGAVKGEVGNISFVHVGDITGDGSLSFVRPKGLYFGYASDGGEASNFYYFTVTDGLDAVATRCRGSIASTIRLLPIPPAANVYEQAYPDAGNVTFPCTLVSVDGVQESDEQGLSTRDDVGRPVKIQIADRANKHDHSKLPLWESWRQAIERCFRNQQLAGVPESKICRIEPYQIIDPALPQFEWMVSGLVVRCVTREPRGVGV